MASGDNATVIGTMTNSQTVSIQPAVGKKWAILGISVEGTDWSQAGDVVDFVMNDGTTAITFARYHSTMTTDYRFGIGCFAIGIGGTAYNYAANAAMTIALEKPIIVDNDTYLQITHNVTAGTAKYVVCAIEI